METRILNDLVLSKGLVMAVNLSEFPENPQIGTFVIKDQCLYGYIKIGGMETWYPFASKTNSYVHTQGLAATNWTITHNLGTSDVWIQIKDSNGAIVQALTEVIDANTVKVHFTVAITGTAVVVAPDSIDVPQIKATSLEVSNGDVVIDSSGIRINGSYVLTDANITQIAEQAANDAIAASTTDNIAEGTNNKYFTQVRARETISGGTGVTYNQATGQVSIGQSVAKSATPQFNGLVTSGHIVPTADITYDLGQSDKRFRDLYLSGSAIYVGDGIISFDATMNSFSFNSATETDSSYTQSSISYTAATTTANQVMDTTPVTAARTIKYIIQANNGSNYQSSEMILVHNDLQSFSTEYAVVETASGLATFATDISSGNVRLLVTPASANTSFKIIKTILN